MKKTISLTNKWQIHIPAALRPLLGGEAPARLEIEPTKDGLLIRRANDGARRFTESAGKYHYKLAGLPQDAHEASRDDRDYPGR
jgi:bifunctional DNA-binding transcriptional regulator/antitoxin component of YhaV-PrlF toxin-antitoxin module